MKLKNNNETRLQRDTLDKLYHLAEFEFEQGISENIDRIRLMLLSVVDRVSYYKACDALDKLTDDDGEKRKRLSDRT